MPTNSRVLTFVLALFFLVSAVFGRAEPVSAAVKEAVGWIMTGAPADETALAMTLEISPTPEHLATKYRRALAASPEAQAQVAERAFVDAWGQAPKEGELASGGTYWEQLEAYRERLVLDPAAYAAVLQRAYRWVIQREAYEEEIEYWRARPALPFLLLVGCLEDWARRNQPGLMVTSGTPTISVNCPYLDTCRLRPDEAEAVRALLGRAGSDVEIGPILAPGADSVVSGGGIAFVAIGSAQLREGAAE